MKRIYPLLFAVLIPLSILAQNACDGTRYTTEIFPDVMSTTVKFGENIDYQGDFQELYMDVYEPVGDVVAERPVIIMAFGGSFISGNRGNLQVDCERFARKGYVAVAIDYRLYEINFFNLPDSIVMLDVVMKAVADMKASVRYLRKDADTNNQFRIDPDFIFVGGKSAGGIVALQTAYVDAGDNLAQYVLDGINANGGFEGDTDDPANSAIGYSSAVQGVVSYFGALHRRYWLDNNSQPLISIHGTDDNTVPYNHGFARVSGLDIISMDGSGVLHPYADGIGLTNHLITVPGGGHGGFPQVFNDSMNVEAGRFMEAIICAGNTACSAIDLIVDDNPILSGTYQAVSFVSSASTVDYDNQVVFKAGEIIELSIGFTAADCEFSAEIEDCGL